MIYYCFRSSTDRAGKGVEIADVNIDCDDLFSDSFLSDLMPLAIDGQSTTNMVIQDDDDFLLEMKDLLS